VSGDGLLRVVVADDEPDQRFLLTLQLDRLQDMVVVGEARHGGEALEVAAAERADVVVMDLLMPVVDGFTAIARLRQELPHVGVVAYSAVAGDFAREETRRQGVELVLKSGDITPLADALRRCVA
jgi:two-component system, NarL family, nitrate/nitrite response regulator NarL